MRVVALLAVALMAVAVVGNNAIPSVPTVRLANSGVEMPRLGIGSCCGSYNVTDWINLGFRHIDTSCDYGSEPNIGQVVAASGIARSDFFITSKINPEMYGTDVEAAFTTAVLQPLNMKYVDLLLMHHAGRHKTDKNPHPPCFDAKDPGGTYHQCRVETFKAMKSLKAKGQVRAIGVSNWEVRDLMQVYNVTGEFPDINQIEHHPYWHTDDIIQFCKEKGIAVEGYAPFANDHFNMLQDPTIVALAKQIGKTVGETILRWDLQAGADVVIPRSKNMTHMLENGHVFDFSLTSEEVESLSHFKQQKAWNTKCQPWC